MLYQNFSQGVHTFRWLIDNSDLWQAGVENGFLLTKTNLESGKVEQFQLRNTTTKYFTDGGEKASIQTMMIS